MSKDDAASVYSFVRIALLATVLMLSACSMVALSGTESGESGLAVGPAQEAVSGQTPSRTSTSAAGSESAPSEIGHLTMAAPGWAKVWAPDHPYTRRSSCPQACIGETVDAFLARWGPPANVWAFKDDPEHRVFLDYGPPWTTAYNKLTVDATSLRVTYIFVDLSTPGSEDSRGQQLATTTTLGEARQLARDIMPSDAVLVASQRCCMYGELTEWYQSALLTKIDGPEWITVTYEKQRRNTNDSEDACPRTEECDTALDMGLTSESPPSEAVPSH